MQTRGRGWQMPGMADLGPRPLEPYSLRALVPPASDLPLRPLAILSGKRHISYPLKKWGNQASKSPDTETATLGLWGVLAARRLTRELQVRGGSLWRRAEKPEDGGPGPGTITVRGDFREQNRPPSYYLFSGTQRWQEGH